MKAAELIQALSKKLKTTSQVELAKALGVTVGTIGNWKKKDEKLGPVQVAAAIAKSRSAAVQTAQIETIQPIVELFPIAKTESARGANWEVIRGGTDTTEYARGLKNALQENYGIYIFYDSRGHALYVGKARESSIWKEMNNAFNRSRGKVQSIKLTSHPSRNQEFKPGYEKLRQPKPTELGLYDLSFYFSAYKVDDGMIDDLEALMVRSFANSLLNIKMETFAHSKS